MAAPTTPQPTPAEVYGIFAGMVDSAATKKIADAIAVASSSPTIKRVHLAFQSNGGGIGEGIFIYNLFRTVPFDLILYNIGTVSSIAVIAYLGAKTRKVGAHAAFMIHRTQTTTQAANTQTIKSFTNAAIIADNRTEAILRAHITMPNDKWAHFDHNDLWFSAEDAISSGLATEVAEFCPPAGMQLFSL